MRFEIRRADASDADAIVDAHLDSIRSIGPAYYDAAIVREWGAHIAAASYRRAMQAGEAFFIAVDPHDAQTVLGFSAHHGDGADHGIGVYVRGSAARRGIGSALLQRAEADAVKSGATSLVIDASLAAVQFYRVAGFEESGRGMHRLPSGCSMACVSMRKRLV